MGKSPFSGLLYIYIFIICHFWGIVIFMICHCITILWRNCPTVSWNFSVDFQDVPLYHQYIFWMLSQCCQICYQICYYTCFHVLPCSFDTCFVCVSRHLRQWQWLQWLPGSPSVGRGLTIYAGSLHVFAPRWDAFGVRRVPRLGVAEKNSSHVTNGGVWRRNTGEFSPTQHGDFTSTNLEL